MLFILSLDKPLRQGNTDYPFIVMQFKKDFQVPEPIKIKLKPEQIKEIYGTTINEEYSGFLYDVVSKIFKGIVNLNIIIPGSFKR